VRAHSDNQPVEQQTANVAVCVFVCECVCVWLIRDGQERDNNFTNNFLIKVTLALIKLDAMLQPVKDLI